MKTAILCFCMLLLALTLVACAETTPYDEYDAQGYTVRVKYDANGGMFTTNVEVIVDSYSYADLPEADSGNKEIALLSPDDPARGKGNYYTASRAGYFFAGWYIGRDAVVDSQGRELDANGQVAAESGQPVAYTYSGRWDFENGRLEIMEENGQISDEPVTLYAAWIPEFTYEFYSLRTGEKIGQYAFDPNYIKELKLPAWSEATGTLELGNFPASDTTLGADAESTLNVDGIYTDSEGKNAVSGTTITHTGTYDLTDATAQNTAMKLYIDYLDGEWYRIYTAKQFLDNASVRGCYQIMADLDFEGLGWKTSLMYGNFRGRIEGNGYTFKNITLEQTDAAKQNAGLFGRLTAEAVISDVTLENVTFTVQSGTRMQDVSYGLLCGTLDTGATLTGVAIQSSRLELNGSAASLDSCAIGLVCGSGWSESLGISYEGIAYAAVGDYAGDIHIEQTGNELTVTPAT